MKIRILCLLLLTFTSIIAFSQQTNQATTMTYNADLAKRLGADERGMKKYVIAFLKAGPVKLTDSIARVELQKAHMKNITRMSEEGKLILAGPFLDDQPLRGIYIFDVATLDEARELTATDPAIKAGTLIIELHPWYGSAGLNEVPKLHKQLQKKAVGE